MKRITWLTLVLTVMFVLQYGAAVTHAAGNEVLLDPRDGMYMTRIINLTGEQLSISAANDTSTSGQPATQSFVSPYPNYYSTGFSTSGNPLNNQQNVFTSLPIKLDTLVQHNPSKTYAFPQGTAYWEGMINLTPLIPASNENTSYITYSGHFSQGQRLTITTVNNANSLLNNASLLFGYNYASATKINWSGIFDFAATTIKNAADIAAACEDDDVTGGLKAAQSEIKAVAQALQTKPITASLNSASNQLTTAPATTQTSAFTTASTTNYAQVQAFFASANGGGTNLTDMTNQNQLYTLASAKQMVVTLTASDGSVRYFTAPAYCIYIKNVEAAEPTDINECTIVIIDGWIYNLAVAMYNSTQPGPNNPKPQTIANLQNLTPLQLMYYAGSPNPPLPESSTAPAQSVNANTQGPVTITSATISYIGG
jgi:hypothetical protein